MNKELVDSYNKDLSDEEKKLLGLVEEEEPDDIDKILSGK